MDESSSLKLFDISDTTVNSFLKLLDIFKQANYKNDGTCTKYGFQTKNILRFEPALNVTQALLKEIGKDTQGMVCEHVHIIDYAKGGYQEPHNHATTEDFSFILYLNDSPDGETIFYEIGPILPKKGQCVFFKSDILHWAVESHFGKKIVVGALKKV